MPKNTKAFILYNLEAYLVLKYFSDAYLVTKIIDI